MSRNLGPGYARDGVHPIRQPQGPPPLDHLIAFPTSRHPGSQNFATRRRSHTVDDILPPGSRPRNGSLPSLHSSESFHSLGSEDGGVGLTWEDGLEYQTPRSRKQSTIIDEQEIQPPKENEQHLSLEHEAQSPHPDQFEIDPQSDNESEDIFEMSHSQHLIGLKAYEDCASEQSRLLGDWMDIAPGKAFDRCTVDLHRLLDDWQHMSPGLAIPTEDLDPEELYIAPSAADSNECKDRRVIFDVKTKRQYQIPRLSQYRAIPRLQTRQAAQTAVDWRSYNSRMSNRILSTIWQKLQFTRRERQELGAMIRGPLVRVEGPLFGPCATEDYKTLTVRPTKKGLQTLKKAIQHPLYSHHIRQVVFDCALITTLWHYFCLRRLRRPLAQIIRILEKLSGSSIIPIRDALVHLLESFLWALDTRRDVWAVWGPNLEHSWPMQAHCKLRGTSIAEGNLQDHLVYDYKCIFDPGFTLMGQRDVDVDTWLSIFEHELVNDSMEYDLLLGGLPDPKQPNREGIGYTLNAFKQKLVTNYMTSIEITRSSLFLDGLLALLEFNKSTLLSLKLRDLHDQPSSIM